MSRRKIDPFAQASDEVDPSLLGGEEDIPYDQTAAPEEPAPPPVEAAPDPTADPAAAAPAPDPMLSQLGSAPQASSDQMSDTDLAGLDAGGLEGLQDPQEQEVSGLEAAMSDPNTSPEERQLIEQQIALAARRKMATMTGAL